MASAVPAQMRRLPQPQPSQPVVASVSRPQQAQEARQLHRNLFAILTSCLEQAFQVVHNE